MVGYTGGRMLDANTVVVTAGLIGPSITCIQIAGSCDAARAVVVEDRTVARDCERWPLAKGVAT
jgi:hypothetical protein